MRRRVVVAWVACAVAALPGAVAAAGISVDAGLTPPEGRWILRTQYRTMTREARGDDDVPRMRRHVVPLVAVYGLRPSVTLGLRQAWEARTMTMAAGETEATGLADLHLFGKVKVLRVNTRSHVLGVSPTFAVEPPTGSDGISSGAWDLAAGLNVSARAGSLGLDAVLDHTWTGAAGLDPGRADPGDRLAANAALAYQIPVGRRGDTAVAPVLELSWQEVGADEQDGVPVPDTGERVLALAPGVKVTDGDLIVEGLVRLPVSQAQAGPQLAAGPMLLLGLRRMF